MPYPGKKDVEAYNIRLRVMAVSSVTRFPIFSITAKFNFFAGISSPNQPLSRCFRGLFVFDVLPSPGRALLFFLIKKVGKKIKAAEKWLQITAFA
jgi:hypothetical protein